MRRPLSEPRRRSTRTPGQGSGATPWSSRRQRSPETGKQRQRSLQRPRREVAGGDQPGHAGVRLEGGAPGHLSQRRTSMSLAPAPRAGGRPRASGRAERAKACGSRPSTCVDMGTIPCTRGIADLAGYRGQAPGRSEESSGIVEARITMPNWIPRCSNCVRGMKKPSASVMMSGAELFMRPHRRHACRQSTSGPRSGVFSNIVMCSVAAARSLALVRTEPCCQSHASNRH